MWAYVCVSISSADKVESQLLTTELTSRPLSRPQRIVGYSTPVILAQSSRDANKAIPVTQFTSTAADDGFQPNLFLVLNETLLSNENPAIISPVFFKISIQKQYSSVVIFGMKYKSSEVEWR